MILVSPYPTEMYFSLFLDHCWISFNPRKNLIRRFKFSNIGLLGIPSSIQNLFRSDLCKNIQQSLLQQGVAVNNNRIINNRNNNGN